MIKEKQPQEGKRCTSEHGGLPLVWPALSLVIQLEDPQIYSMGKLFQCEHKFVKHLLHLSHVLEGVHDQAGAESSHLLRPLDKARNKFLCRICGTVTVMDRHAASRQSTAADWSLH